LGLRAMLRITIYRIEKRCKRRLRERICTIAFALGVWLATSASGGNFIQRVDQIADRANAFAITHISLIDGTGTPPQPDTTVVVSDGRIVYVGPSRATRRDVDLPTIDGRGRFLLPGLIDTHAHVTYLNWATEPGSASTASYDDDISRASLRLLLAFGITTVRNPAGPTAAAVALRDRVAAGDLLGPSIKTAGEILNRAPRFDGLTRPVASEADIQREVAAQAAAKVDYVKVYGNLPPDLVGSAIRAAHDKGLKIIGHLQATSWTDAARLGIDAIAHGASWAVDELPPERRDAYRQAIVDRGAMRARLQWLDDVQPDGREIRIMIGELARRRIPVDPTLIAYATKFDGRASRFVDSPDLRVAPEPMRLSFPTLSFVRDWSDQDFEHGRRSWSKMQALVRAYQRGGVLLTAGSDEPNSWIVPGPGLHTELELLVEAGLSPIEVLTIATRNGAASLGILNDVGTISVGKRADLIVVDNDPAQDIRHTRAISLVVSHGRRFRPSDLYGGR
jgi:imidazolonepropionase-like amidohydrolase